VEYPLVFSRLDYKGEKENRKVMDVGCYYSNFPIQLASMGFSVTGVDLEDYQLTHPNFKFVKGDVTRLKFKDKFDIVTSVSTIEHVGLGYYKDNEDTQNDVDAIFNMARYMKKGGRMIITVPFGKRGVTESYRSYDMEQLKGLFGKMKIKETLFYRETRKKWIPAKLKEMEKIKNVGPVKGMVMVVAEK